MSYGIIIILLCRVAFVTKSTPKMLGLCTHERCPLDPRRLPDSSNFTSCGDFIRYWLDWLRMVDYLFNLLQKEITHRYSLNTSCTELFDWQGTCATLLHFCIKLPTLPRPSFDLTGVASERLFLMPRLTLQIAFWRQLDWDAAEFVHNFQVKCRFPKTMLPTVIPNNDIT